MRSHHKSISLHKQSAVGATDVECYACQGRNLFMLGFVPAKHEVSAWSELGSMCTSTGAFTTEP